jgi:tetratricopeptide (TPR) repeat protein
LQNLDEWQQAELALRDAREFARRTGRPDRGTLFSAAVLRYCLGQWDDALAELGPDACDLPGPGDSFLRERWAALLLHGVAALIAGRRDQRAAASRHLEKGLALPIEGVVDRENRDFLVAAHALSLEQSGDIRAAMLRLAELIPRGDNEMTLTHQWLPGLVRLALAAGDRQLAQAAAKACQQEATEETRPGRAAAASLWCYGLLEPDPDRLAEAVAHYRTVGPAVDLPAALEDLAVVLAERGHKEEARAVLNEAVSMQAQWDIRPKSQLRPHGITGTRGRRGPRLPPAGIARLPRLKRRPGGRRRRRISPATSVPAKRRPTSHILVKLGPCRVDIVRRHVRRYRTGLRCRRTGVYRMVCCQEPKPGGPLPRSISRSRACCTCSTPETRPLRFSQRLSGERLVLE